MTIERVQLSGASVTRDSLRPYRWLNAEGVHVTRWDFNPANLPLVSTTSLPGHTQTAMTSGNMSLLGGADGGAFVITAGAGDNQGGQIQAMGEAFSFASRWPAYFGACIAVNDADQTDVEVGLVITDTAVIDGNSDSVSFRSVDEAATILAKTEKGSVESTITAGTLLDDTYHVVEFYFDGSFFYFYFDNTLAGSVAYADVTVPNTEYLTPTLAFLTGEASANTMSVKWARAFQIRQA